MLSRLVKSFDWPGNSAVTPSRGAMSYSDDEANPFRERKAVSRHSDDEPANNSSNTAVIAGLVLAGVGIAAAVGARIILKKKPAVAPSRPSKSRADGRKRVPPRRARSIASETASEPRR